MAGSLSSMFWLAKQSDINASVLTYSWKRKDGRHKTKPTNQSEVVSNIAYVFCL